MGRRRGLQRDSRRGQPPRSDKLDEPTALAGLGIDREKKEVSAPCGGTSSKTSLTSSQRFNAVAFYLGIAGNAKMEYEGMMIDAANQFADMLAKEGF